MDPKTLKAAAKSIARATAAADDPSSALRRTNAADERIKTAEALARLASMPDGGDRLIGALRQFRRGHDIDGDLFTSLARRGMVFQYRSLSTRSLTRLGWNVINMYEAITTSK